MQRYSLNTRRYSGTAFVVTLHSAHHKNRESRAPHFTAVAPTSSWHCTPALHSAIALFWFCRNIFESVMATEYNAYNSR